MIMAIGLAAMLAGMAMKAKAASEAKKAAAKYTKKETDRREGYQHEAQSKLSDVLSQLDRSSVEASMEQAAADRFGAVQDSAGLQAGDDSYIEGSASAPKVVREAGAKSLSRALSAGKERARLMGELGSFGDFSVGMGRKLGRSREDISRLARMAQASGAILPMELEGAKGAGAGWRTAGDISSGIGSMMMGGAGGGAGMAGMFGGMMGGGAGAGA